MTEGQIAVFLCSILENVFMPHCSRAKYKPLQPCKLLSCQNPVMCRAEASSPQPSVPVATSSSPARDSASQALWSPDTPEYVPRFTCCYDETAAGQEAGVMQIGSGKDAAEMTAQESLEKHSASKAPVPKPSGYGSSSFAPLAGRRSAT